MRLRLGIRKGGRRFSLGCGFEDIHYKNFGFYSELNGKSLKVSERERERKDQLSNSNKTSQVRYDSGLDQG